MSPRIFSIRARTFGNIVITVSGTGAQQPSMAMEAMTRTGAGQRQSRHRGCGVGTKEEKKKKRKRKKERKNSLGNLKHKVQNMCPPGRRRARALPLLQHAAPCCVQMHGEFGPFSPRRRTSRLNLSGNRERESKRGRGRERERGPCRQHYEKATHQ